MKNLSLADIHCDTVYELYMRGQSFYDNSLSISYELSDCYESYIQIAAIWTQKKLDNNAAYEQFFKISRYFKNDIAQSYCASIYNGKNLKDTKTQFILAVEDARLLDGKIERLDSLYAEGVRFLTLLWKGKTCIGGSFDTDVGLTEFGKTTVKRCMELGIVPDISHASLKSAEDVFEICEGKVPVIASHSSSYSVFKHPRNLTDSHFKRIRSSEGLVGINLYTTPLGLDKNKKGLDTVIEHIEHYLELDGENIICLGCDFDGADTPSDMPNIASLNIIADELARRNYKTELIEKLFYKNVETFIVNNLSK